eukprot:m.115225 g.115225  ORF g.115225 m.115225 type:complete len:621 (+) comp15484_c0_seq2:75-1937(+)
MAVQSAVLATVGLLLIALGSVQGAEEHFVVTLGDANISSSVDEDGSIWLVEWYAPWCGHCQQLKPEYEEASRQLKEKAPTVKLAAIDATIHAESASNNGVSGYPTLKVFRDGKVYDYDGGRTATDIVSYMTEQASPSWKPPVSSVVDLTADTFDSFVDNEAISLVYFFAPWCGHCKQLTPEYEKAARDLAPTIKLAKVDATQESGLAERFDVTGYPTLKVFRKGQASDYTGERQRQAIVEEMKAEASPAAQVINSVFDMEEFVKGDGDSVQLVAFLESGDDNAAEQWQKVASSLRKAYKFAISTSDAVRSKYKGTKTGQVVLFQPPKYHSQHEPAAVAVDLSKLQDASSVTSWIEGRALPLVGHRVRPGKLSGYNFVERMPQLVVYYKVDFGPALFKDTAYWRERLIPLAKEFPALTFTIADEEEFERDLKDLGRYGADEEFTVAIYNDAQKYLMQDEFDMDAVREFAENYLAGDLPRYIKSAPVPRRQDGHVVDVVGSTFDKIVQDPSKEVLIELYASWCGHCKALTPKYESLAKKLRKVKDLVVARIEATENDVPDEYEIKGFPTIFFKPKGSDPQLVEYEDARDVDGFLNFLRQNAEAKIPKFKKKTPQAQAPKEEL